jgi:hypothetical protein
MDLNKKYYCSIAKTKIRKKWYVNTYSRKRNEKYLHFTSWQPSTFSIQKLQFGQIFHLLRPAWFISSISFSSEVPWKLLVLNSSWLDNWNVESSSKMLHFLIISSVTILWHIHCSPKRPFSPFKHRLNGKQKSAVLFRP